MAIGGMSRVISLKPNPLDVYLRERAPRRR
jgi:hypothetical protein